MKCSECIFKAEKHPLFDNAYFCNGFKYYPSYYNTIKASVKIYAHQTGEGMWH